MLSGHLTPVKLLLCHLILLMFLLLTEGSLSCECDCLLPPFNSKNSSSSNLGNSHRMCRRETVSDERGMRKLPVSLTAFLAHVILFLQSPSCPSLYFGVILSNSKKDFFISFFFSSMCSCYGYSLILLCAALTLYFLSIHLKCNLSLT